MADSKAGGRPTDYTDEKLAKAQEYVTKYEGHGHVIPSVAGLAMVLGAARKTMYEWAEREGNDEFRYTLGLIGTNQEVRLLNNGLDGSFNSTITKLALCNHGYSDKPVDEDGAQLVKIEIVNPHDEG